MRWAPTTRVAPVSSVRSAVRESPHREEGEKGMSLGHIRPSVLARDTICPKAPVLEFYRCEQTP